MQAMPSRFSRAPTAVLAIALSTQSTRLKSTWVNSSAPVSIRDRSRMFSISPSRLVPLPRIASIKCACSSARLPADLQQLGGTDHAVQGRAQLMAHVGKETRLGERRRLGLVALVLQRARIFCRAPVAVAMGADHGLTERFDIVEQLVDRRDQIDLVGSNRRQALVMLFLRGQFACLAGQRIERACRLPRTHGAKSSDRRRCERRCRRLYAKSEPCQHACSQRQAAGQQ